VTTLRGIRTRLTRREPEERGCAVVLMYHSISRRRPDRFNVCVDPDLFAEQLQLLRDRFHVVSLDELRSALVRDQRLTRAVAITFDDGYRDNLLVAKPLLERHGLPATVFIATGFVGSGRDFWWHELDAVCTSGGLKLWPLWEELGPLPHEERLARLDALWASSGAARPEPSMSLDRTELERLADGGLIGLGAHTVTHPLLSSLPGPQQRQEIEDSSAYLTELVGRPVRDFCYPHGDFSPETAALVESAGFETASTTRSAPVTRETSPLELPRVAVMNWNAETFERELERRLA
jgi:peptidoglycan/xylan/chitin deacetylase (PgdA/CDA1 family)